MTRNVISDQFHMLERTCDIFVTYLDLLASHVGFHPIKKKEEKKLGSTHSQLTSAVVAHTIHSPLSNW